jgi:hypothetical protein
MESEAAVAEVIETVHDLVEAWARLGRDHPGAGRAQVDALSADDAEALWERYDAEEAVVANANGTCAASASPAGSDASPCSTTRDGPAPFRVRPPGMSDRCAARILRC